MAANDDVVILAGNVSSARSEEKQKAGFCYFVRKREIFSQDTEINAFFGQAMWVEKRTRPVDFFSRDDKYLKTLK